jgi:hypothetical protein
MESLNANALMKNALNVQNKVSNMIYAKNAMMVIMKNLMIKQTDMGLLIVIKNLKNIIWMKKMENLYIYLVMNLVNIVSMEEINIIIIAQVAI